MVWLVVVWSVREVRVEENKITLALTFAWSLVLFYFIYFFLCWVSMFEIGVLLEKMDLGWALISCLFGFWESEGDTQKRRILELSFWVILHFLGNQTVYLVDISSLFGCWDNWGEEKDSINFGAYLHVLFLFSHFLSNQKGYFYLGNTIFLMFI